MATESGDDYHSLDPDLAPQWPVTRSTPLHHPFVLFCSVSIQLNSQPVNQSNSNGGLFWFVNKWVKIFFLFAVTSGRVVVGGGSASPSKCRPINRNHRSLAKRGWMVGCECGQGLKLHFYFICKGQGGDKKKIFSPFINPSKQNDAWLTFAVVGLLLSC